MKPGKILLVGFGPGDAAHMSLRARQAIAEADVVIGYSTYIKLVQDLLDGKQVIRKGMTEEIDRCVEAWEHARQGRTVALVSSGDIGIYGMAGPTFEVLFQAGWTPDSGIHVEVIPGSTALSACAALVGAPLTHDFCAISLSDLLTPWPVIARRLEAAGRGDFVIALYNPKSGRRTRHIVEAQQILLRHRSPQTPVAIVKSAYRRAQNIQLVTLAEMADCDIGMLTTVLIGNGSSFVRHGLMVTPRGYTHKYQDLAGPAKAGEQPGRSLTLGLDGWQAGVRRFLNDNPACSLNHAARHFDVPVGAVLSAISQATAGDEAGGFAAAAGPGEPLRLLEAARHWGPVRLVVRSPAGAVSELLARDVVFTRRGDWLNIENAHFHLHVDGSRIERIWLVQHRDRLRAAWLVDAGGEPVFNLSLVRRDGRFDPEAERHFQRAWQSLVNPEPKETASHA